MRLTKENLLVIEKLGASNYAPRQVCLYFGFDKRKFYKEFENENSELRVAFERGKLKADFDISDKLLENATAGNITAIQIFSNKQEERSVQEKIRKHFMLDD